MSVTDREPAEPFAMRFAARQTGAPADTIGVTYDNHLQIALTREGNPWAMTAAGETSSNTNSDSRNDEGTDFY
ncbi:putative ATP-grasp-modified RiPP [Streptomyces sp. B-S-A8]|uniref:ATP-grasp-modified RiPP n=1 Tax=Streptomyces solicavernae TaxID=3043614 RepID=A0ABT6RQ13_9ACTN|nr:putative ATP-grasp-modified RiPP [Streptomyces sp. B-S-A8]MDI3386534.1 putative ATP-grasp-modified RiPP [Streptomyces sp. B-S-A8]